MAVPISAYVNYGVSAVAIGVLGYLFYSAIGYLAAGRDEARAKRAKRGIMYSILSVFLLFVYFAAYNVFFTSCCGIATR